MAVMSATRHPALPSVPTMIESGFRDFEIVGWTGVLAPAGTPTPIVDRLNAEFGKALAASDVKRQFEAAGFDAQHMWPAEFRKFLADDIARLESVARAAGIEKQ